MLPLRHRHVWIVASAVLVAAVVYGSLQPNLAIPAPTNFDKVEHLSAYLALAVWFTGLYPRGGYWKVAVALLALGLSMEVLQGLMNIGRSAELLDMVANTAGVLAGVLLGVWFTGGWARRIESWLGSN
jgi:VanZ family protein